MQERESHNLNHPNRRKSFATTHWSMVVEAGKGDSPASQAALAQLCETYWYPLYVYTRRQGFSSDDAADLTQGFLADLLSRQDLGQVERNKGRFRSFLLASLKHFILNEIDRAKAMKRGGGRKLLSLDFDQADSRFRQEPSHDQTPELDFEKQWARAVLDSARAALKSEYYSAGKHTLFDRLHPFISDFATGADTYQAIAEELEMSEGAIKVAVHRLRQRFQSCLRTEISATVLSDDEIDEEIRALFEALRA